MSKLLDPSPSGTGAITSFTVRVWLKFGDHLVGCASRSRFSSSSGELVGKTLVIGPIWEGDSLSPGVVGRLRLFTIFEMACSGLVLACMTQDGVAAGRRQNP